MVLPAPRKPDNTVTGSRFDGSLAPGAVAGVGMVAPGVGRKTYRGLVRKGKWGEDRGRWGDVMGATGACCAQCTLT